jgi:hypothetical protein
VLDIWLRDHDYLLPIWGLLLIAVIIIVAVWLVSIFYDKSGMIKYEATFSNKRNPLLLKQLEEIAKIRRLLEDADKPRRSRRNL